MPRCEKTHMRSHETRSCPTSVRCSPVRPRFGHRTHHSAGKDFKLADCIDGGIYGNTVQFRIVVESSVQHEVVRILAGSADIDGKIPAHGTRRTLGGAAQCPALEGLTAGNSVHPEGSVLFDGFQLRFRCVCYPVQRARVVRLQPFLPQDRRDPCGCSAASSAQPTAESRVQRICEIPRAPLRRDTEPGLSVEKTYSPPGPLDDCSVALVSSFTARIIALGIGAAALSANCPRMVPAAFAKMQSSAAVRPKSI